MRPNLANVLRLVPQLAPRPFWIARYVRDGMPFQVANTAAMARDGGRQLEGAPATIQVLPEIVAAVGDKMEVLLDGGVRRGGDVLKALALGAKAVLIGRPFVWGLALGGQDGVSHMLELLRAEMKRSMQLMGCQSVHDLDRSWVSPPP